MHVPSRQLWTIKERRADDSGWVLTDWAEIADYVANRSEWRLEPSTPYGELAVSAREVRPGDQLGWVKGSRIIAMLGEATDAPRFKTEDGGWHYYGGGDIVQIYRPSPPADPYVTVTHVMKQSDAQIWAKHMRSTFTLGPITEGIIASVEAAHEL